MILLFSLFLLFQTPQNILDPKYTILQESIPEGPFAYVGLHRREIITFDPLCSPLLNCAYASFLNFLPPDFSQQEILQQLAIYVRENVFDPKLCTDCFVFQLIQKYSQSQEDLPQIPLDAFIEAKTGVCRHIALTTTYFLEKLIQQGILEGHAFLIREQIPAGRHGWSLFLSDEEAWHIDPYWGIIENGKNSIGFKRLCQKYGKQTMDKQKKRWE